MSIFYLLYVEVSLILSHWSRENIDIFVCILHCFYLSSNLKLNHQKSRLFCVGVNKDEVQNFVFSMGCGMDYLSSLYYVFHLGLICLKKWSLIMDTFCKNITKWKVNKLIGFLLGDDLCSWVYMLSRLKFILCQF